MTTDAVFDALLVALPRWIIVGGKGGVGKTTCAIALAKRATGRVLLLSTDPARSLSTALSQPIGASPVALFDHPSVFAQQLDAAAERDKFLARWRSALVAVIDRGTYLDRDDITGLVDAVLPGTDEAMALLSLADLATAVEWTRVIIDTAPTGHTLRLLALPEMFRLVVELLELMQDKHRFMVRALTHAYRSDAVDAMLGELRRQVATLQSTLADPASTRIVLVTRPEPVVIAETIRYAAALPSLSLHPGALVINAAPPGADLSPFATILPDVPHFTLPNVPHFTLPNVPHFAPPDVPRFTLPSVAVPPFTRASEGREGAEVLLLALTVVGGKGGVGKTTVACALGLEAADRGGQVLVVSTDPAPSVADALEMEVGDQEVQVEGVPGLWARQADAALAFAQMEARYRERVDGMFDRLIGSGIDPAHDRRILRELLSLTPPGIDELYALAAIGETLAEQRFKQIVVDPAPTGHLLRLLESPAMALDWSHRLMRLMLKYKEVAAFGDAAGDILAFAKRTRAVRDLLVDRTRAGLIVVTLDEPLVRAEAERLASAVTDLGVAVTGVIWNRAASAGLAPLSTPGPVPQFAAPSESPPPRGVAAIRRWRARWSPLTR